MIYPDSSGCRMLGRFCDESDSILIEEKFEKQLKDIPCEYYNQYFREQIALLNDNKEHEIYVEEYNRVKTIRNIENNISPKMVNWRYDECVKNRSKECNLYSKKLSKKVFEIIRAIAFDAMEEDVLMKYEELKFDDIQMIHLRERAKKELRENARISKPKFNL